jgi:hypothetical protein
MFRICDLWNKLVIGAVMLIILMLTVVDNHADASSEDKSVILRQSRQISERLKQNPIFSDAMKIEPDEATMISATAQGISQVIDVFLIKKSLRFDLLICGEATHHIRDLTNELLSRIGKLTSTMILHISSLDECLTRKIDKTVVIFTKNQYFVRMFNRHYYLDKPTDINLKIPIDSKIFFYVEEKSTDILNLFPPIIEDEKMIIIPIFTFEFLLLNEQNTLELKTVSYFTEGQCEEAKIEDLNSMSKASGKWIKKLENFYQLTNFHGCLIKFFHAPGPFFYADEFASLLGSKWINVDSDPKIKQIINRGNLTLRGIFYNIIEMAAKKANFTAYHQISMRTESVSLIDSFVPQKGLILFAKFDMNPILLTHAIFSSNKIHTVYFKTPYASHDSYFLVTPNDFYTNYEKLFFPFEQYAWMCFGLSFGFAFGAIYLVNRLQRRVRNVFFGLGIKNPTYNALGIFFGISQTKLPRENFARILLAMFLFLCLIFRTCYQSKMFEFMTTDMRKPPPETLEDLISMNYTVVVEFEQYPGYWETQYANIALQLYEELINGRPK